MAIKKPEVAENGTSLAVCLDTILKFNGITVQSQAMLEEGLDAVEILLTDHIIVADNDWVSLAQSGLYRAEECRMNL